MTLMIGPAAAIPAPNARAAANLAALNAMFTLFLLNARCPPCNGLRVTHRLTGGPVSTKVHWRRLRTFDYSGQKRENDPEIGSPCRIVSESLQRVGFLDRKSTRLNSSH